MVKSAAVKKPYSVHDLQDAGKTIEQIKISCLFRKKLQEGFQKTYSSIQVSGF